MRLVILESPYAGSGDGLQTTEMNVFYAQHCVRDTLMRGGESCYASHLLYTQPNVLDDKNPAERKLGMEAGFAWREHADATVVYTDLGITRGMRAGIARAENMNALASHAIEYRQLPESFWTRPLLDVGPGAQTTYQREVLHRELHQFRKLYAIARSELQSYALTIADGAMPLQPMKFVVNEVTFAAGPTPDEPRALHSGRERAWVRCMTCCEEANADLPFLHHATTSVQAQVMGHGVEKHGWQR